MVRVVLDTNVLVSALIDDGKPRKLVLELLDKHTVVLSRQMLAELADVISRDKFRVTGSQVNRVCFKLSSYVQYGFLIMFVSKSYQKTLMMTWSSTRPILEKQSSSLQGIDIFWSWVISRKQKS